MKVERTGDIDKVIDLGTNVLSAQKEMLTQIGEIVSNNAKVNSPFKTGNLRGSIMPDFTELNTGKLIVGSSVAYARIREYENNLHPNTRHYLERGYTEHMPEIGRVIEQVLAEQLK